MTVQIIQANYTDPVHAAALVNVLDAYARDPAGGGAPLSAYAREHVVPMLVLRPQVFSVLAFDAAQAVGLVNCVEGFSTFAARPLVNVHDVAVLDSHRGRGIAVQMLALAEQLARARGACKLTLEVLQGNQTARRLYHRLGFADYQLEPTLGVALFMQKCLV